MRRWLVMCVAWCLLPACGGGGAIPLSELGDRVVTMECAAEVRCQQTPSQQACAATFNVQLNQLMADVASGKTRYDGAAAADCLGAIGSIGCSFSSALGEAPASCDKTFQGTVVDGGPCFTAEECVSQSCNKQACDPAVTCCAGTCGPTQTRVAVGGDCSASGARCVSGSFCQFDNLANTATCAKQVALGQPCGTVDQCAPGLWCHVEAPGPGVGGTCAKLPARGQACDPQTLPCDSSTDTCSSATLKCVARVQPGAACAADEDCVAYANCDMTTGKCVTKGSVGASCAAPSDCLDGLDCQGGACAARPPEPVCS